MPLDQDQGDEDHYHGGRSGASEHVGHDVGDVGTLLGQLDPRGRDTGVLQVLDHITHPGVQHIEPDASLDVVLHAAVLVDGPCHIAGGFALGVVWVHPEADFVLLNAVKDSVGYMFGSQSVLGFLGTHVK